MSPEEKTIWEALINFASDWKLPPIDRAGFSRYIEELRLKWFGIRKGLEPFYNWPVQKRIKFIDEVVEYINRGG